MMLPANSKSASSKARKVSTSKSLDGSSSNNTLPPAMSVLAKCKRPRSPPERVPTRFCWSPPLKLKRPQYARLAISNLPTVKISRPPEMSSHTVLSFAKSSRDCSTKAICTVWPILTSPLSGCCWPAIMRNRVDLPAPFGPMMPTIAPGGTLKLRLSINTRLPNDFVTFTNSMTS